MAKVIYTYNNQILKSTDNEWYTEPGPPSDEVTIGTQTWKNKNLAINDGQGGISTQTVNYGQGNVVEYYYTWDAAVRVAASIPGWHLPTTSEWDALAEAVGGSSTAGTKLKSTYGWESGNGTDNYGFSAFPAGYCPTTDFLQFGKYARFWSANEHESLSTHAYNYYYISTRNKQNSDYNRKTYKYSVRLVKDV